MENYDGSQAANLESQTNAATEQAKSEQEQRNAQTQQQLAQKRQQPQQQKGGAQQKPLVESVAKDAANAGKILGSFKKGGTVPKTGNYRLHEGEVVVPAGKVQGRNSHYRRAYLDRMKSGKNTWGSK